MGWSKESLNFFKTEKNLIKTQTTNFSKGEAMLKDTAETPSYKEDSGMIVHDPSVNCLYH